MTVFAAAMHPNCHHAQIGIKKGKEEEIKEIRIQKEKE